MRTAGLEPRLLASSMLLTNAFPFPPLLEMSFLSLVRAQILPILEGSAKMLYPLGNLP